MKAAAAVFYARADFPGVPWMGDAGRAANVAVQAHGWRPLTGSERQAICRDVLDTHHRDVTV